MMYYFNFGKPVNKECKGQKVAVTEVLEVLKETTDTCEILGKLENKEISLIDNKNPNKGITILYKDGDICNSSTDQTMNGKPRQTKFTIYCSRKQDKNFILDLPGNTQGTTKCILEFSIHSPSGCPNGSYGASSITVLFYFIVFSFCLYLILGMIYNYNKYNLKGLDAVPNKEFWTAFLIKIKSILNSSFAYTKYICGNIINKYSDAKAKNSGYSDI